jgi:hypothetical protein
MPKENIEEIENGDNKKLVSLRLSKDCRDVIPDLIKALKKETGFSKVSQADVYEKAIAEMAERMLRKKK